VTTFTVASNAATIFSGLPSLLIGDNRAIGDQDRVMAVGGRDGSP